eukprot:TRINITY_DN9863_c0_g1_i1.p1 TRINITY_DN9863_c0_g1~~TRINITY_DN9863_c0_g1_i1.p1  ORF type:complete len:258 (+),score=46.63 TRINITY_DN9863_c0_g1_i1:98-871(+)
MHSRSLLLLKRDYEVVNSQLYHGISAQLSTDNYYKWRIIFPALEDSIWTGGEYRVLVEFPPNYNTFPPDIRFLTIPYHPNIDPASGLVNLALLRPTHWTEANSIIDVILSLQQLLSEPYIEDGCVLNSEAASCYTDTPSTYRQIAQDCVVASIKISAGIEPYVYEQTPTPTPVLPEVIPTKQSHPPSLTPAQIQHVSYSDYLSIWSDLATTKPIKKKDISKSNSIVLKHPETNATDLFKKNLSPKGIANISVDRRNK